MGRTAKSMTLGETIASVVVVCAVTSACTLGGGGGGGTSGGGSGTTPRDDGGVSGIGDADADASSNAELGDATLTDVVFVPSEAGPRVLVRGTDPKKRIEWVRVRLLDDKGEPARFDIDGDGMIEPDVVDVPGSALDRGESGFFLEIQSAPHLDDFVKAVSVEIDDGRVPPLAKTASLAPLPVRGPGEACDPQGFDRCSGAMVCAGTQGSARCAAPEAARAERCATAPMILAGASGVVVGGRVSPGASLFEPTIGCTNGLRSDRPEAIFRLFVDRAYGELVLSTESPSTSLDTVVSVLESCGTSARVLACNDDDPPPYSTVVLTDVTPGTYIVVVDSLSRSGGAFELRVTAR